MAPVQIAILFWGASLAKVCAQKTNMQMCASVNEKEASADKAVDLGDAKVLAYENALDAWRIDVWRNIRRKANASITRSMNTNHWQPCRIVFLEKMLCRDSFVVLRSFKYRASTTWMRMQRELASHEINDCMQFHEFRARKWEPQNFLWTSIYYPTSFLRELVDDPLYNHIYAKAAHLALAFGPPPFPHKDFFTSKQISIHRSRAYHLIDVRILRSSVPGFEIARVVQIVDFGVGFGEVAAMLREFGYYGTYVGIDLPAMLLAARFFLRSHSLPAHLAMNRTSSHSKALGKIVLETSTSDWLRHLDDKKMRDTLFLGTLSLMESDLKTRKIIRPFLSKFGIIYLTWHDHSQHGNSLQWSQEFMQNEWKGTHHVLVWSHIAGRLSNGLGLNFLVAVRKDAGFTVQCTAAAYCGLSTVKLST